MLFKCFLKTRMEIKKKKIVSSFETGAPTAAQRGTLVSIGASQRAGSGFVFLFVDSAHESKKHWGKIEILLEDLGLLQLIVHLKQPDPRPTPKKK